MEQIIQEILGDEKKILFVTICFVIITDIVVAIIFFMHSLSFKNAARHVMAEIVDIREVRTSNNGVGTELAIKLNDGMGNDVETKIHASKQGHQVGDKIEVLSHKDRPEKVKWDNFQSLFLIPTMMGVVAPVCLIIVLVMMTTMNMAALPF